MIFEHDPESPFWKILVRDETDLIGIIRRNLKTGCYQFYGHQLGSIACEFNEPRLDRIKLRIEERYCSEVA